MGCSTNAASVQCHFLSGTGPPITDGENLALHKPVVVDSVFDSKAGERAVDGIRGSPADHAWQSVGAGNAVHYLIVDLESHYRLNRVQIDPETGLICGGRVSIWTGLDGVTLHGAAADMYGWETVIELDTQTSSAPVDYSFTPIDTRLVRLDLTSQNCAGSGSRAVIGSFEVFGVPIDPPQVGVMSNVAFGKPAIADSVYGPASGSCGRLDRGMCVAGRAVDGNTTNDQRRWLSTNASPRHWLVVDLEGRYDISRVAVFAGFNRGSSHGLCSHNISVWTGADRVDMTAASRDRYGWTDVVVHTDIILSTEHNAFTAVAARFVRITIDQSTCSTDNIARLYELEIYGVPEGVPTGGIVCAHEGESCTCAGTVFYGAGASWTSLPSTRIIACTNGEFGDPVPGTAKDCQCFPVGDDGDAINVALNRPTLADSIKGPDRGGCGGLDQEMCVSNRAVDGNHEDNFARWVSRSNTEQHWLIIDLEDFFELTRVNIWAGWTPDAGQAHAGLCSHKISVWTGQPGADMRTAAADPNGWTIVVEHSVETTSGVYDAFTAIAARLVRLDVDQSTCDGDPQARVYEVEVYGAPANPPVIGELVDCAAGKPVIADSMYGPSGPSCGTLDDGMCVPRRAVDGVFSESDNTESDSNFHRWVSTDDTPTHWLVVDLLQHFDISGVEIYAGRTDNNVTRSGLCAHNISIWTGAPGVDLNTAGADDGGGWTVVAGHDGELRHVEHVSFSDTVTRLVRLDIDMGRCNATNHARVFELLIFGTRVAQPSFATLILGCCRGDGWDTGMSHIGQTHSVDEAGLACRSADGCTGFDRDGCHNDALREDCNTSLFFHDRANYQGGCDSGTGEAASNRCYVMDAVAPTTDASLCHALPDPPSMETRETCSSGPGFCEVFMETYERPGYSCDWYCAQGGLRCTGAWHEADGCTRGDDIGCAEVNDDTVCRCEPHGSTTPPPRTTRPASTTRPTCEAGQQYYDVRAGRCVALTTCMYGASYQIAAPTGTTDRVCTPVSHCVLGFTYQTTAPTMLADRACSRVTACPEGQCQSIAPTLSANRACGLCPLSTTRPRVTRSSVPTPRPACSTTEWYERFVGICKPIATCVIGSSYEVIAPTAESNRVCHDVTLCMTDYTCEINAPTLTSDRSCSSCATTPRRPPRTPGGGLGVSSTQLPGASHITDTPTQDSQPQGAGLNNSAIIAVLVMAVLLLAVVGVSLLYRRRASKVRYQSLYANDEFQMADADTDELIDDDELIDTTVDRAGGGGGGGKLIFADCDAANGGANKLSRDTDYDLANLQQGDGTLYDRANRETLYTMLTSHPENDHSLAAAAGDDDLAVEPQVDNYIMVSPPENDHADQTQGNDCQMAGAVLIKATKKHKGVAAIIAPPAPPEDGTGVDSSGSVAQNAPGGPGLLSLSGPNVMTPGQTKKKHHPGPKSHHVHTDAHGHHAKSRHDHRVGSHNRSQHD